MAREYYTIRGRQRSGWVAANRGKEFPDEKEFSAASPTPQQIQEALETIARMHPSQAAEIASQLPVSWQDLLKRREVQDELGGKTVVDIQNVWDRYPNRKGEQAALRIMRATLYEKW